MGFKSSPDKPVYMDSPPPGGSTSTKFTARKPVANI